MEQKGRKVVVIGAGFVGKNGVERIITARLSQAEQAALKISTQTLRKVLDKINL